MNAVHHRSVVLPSTGRTSFGMKVLYTVMAAMLLLSCVSHAYAAGTPAGTIIQSRAKAIYTAVNRSQYDTSYSDIVNVTVLQTAAVNIIPSSAEQTVAGNATTSDYGLTVINSGNAADAFQFSVQSSRGWPAALYYDGDGDGMLQGADLADGPITQTPKIPADAAYKIILRLTIPPGQSVNGRQDTAMVRVQSNFTAGVSTQGMYITTIQNVSMNGVLTVDNPAPNRGENVTFTGTFTNTGLLRADSVVISNQIIAGFTYVSASGGIVNSTTSPITWSVGALEPGASAVVTLTVQISGTAAVGTVLSDMMTAAYTVTTGLYTAESTIAQVTVGVKPVYGVTITPLATAAAGEATDTIAYRFRVMNTGNIKTAFRVRTASSKNYVWTLYRDANNNGSWNVSDPLLVEAGAASGAVIDSVAAGDSVRIFAVTILPRGPADQDKDVLQVTATTATGTASDSAIVVTTINVPVIGNPRITYTAEGGTSVASGSVVTYSIGYSNTGHAAVDNFTVVGMAPQYTEYMSNSVSVNGIGVLDDNGSIKVTTDEQQNTVIAVSVGKLSSAKNGSVEFKVKVK
jgi:large repetitive protein